MKDEPDKQEGEQSGDGDIALKLVSEFVNRACGYGFDAIEVIGTRIVNGETELISAGAGNHYARVGAVMEFAESLIHNQASFFIEGEEEGEDFC